VQIDGPVGAQCRLFGCYWKIWLEFPLGGPFGRFEPQDVPRSEFLIVHYIQLVETEIFRYFTSWCIAYCIFVALHFAEIRFSFTIGNPYSPSNFGQFWGDYSGVGSGMSTRPRKGTSLRQNTHFEPSCTFLRLSVPAGREPEKTCTKRVTKSLYFTYVPLEAGLTYRHGTSGKC
jgi:hypothetical protein